MDKMFKRFPRGNKSKGRDESPSKVIGNPVLVGSSMPQEAVQNMRDVGARPGHLDSQNSFSQMDSSLAPPEPRGRDQIASYAPSSVYSQAPYDWNGGKQQQPLQHHGEHDISPPDSPRGYDNQPQYGDGRASTIEQTNALQSSLSQARQGKSGIPVINSKMSQAQAMNKQPSRAYNRDPNQPLKWNKYTGEPTTGDKGLSSQVKPAEFVTGLERSRLRNVSDMTERYGGSNNASPTTSPASRPPWQGASGRAPIVEPPREKPYDPRAKHTAIQIPQARGGAAETAGVSGSGARTPRFETHGATRAMQVQPVRQGDHYSRGPDAHSPMTSTSAAAHATTPISPPNSHRSPYRSPIDDEPPTPPPTNTRFYQGHSNSNSATPTSSQPPRDALNYTKPSNMKADSRSRGADSHFSWTTQATNTTYQHSPPPSPPRPPVPTLPSGMSQHQPKSSVMDRKRPVPGRQYSHEAESDAYSPVANAPTVRRKAILPRGAGGVSTGYNGLTSASGYQHMRGPRSLSPRSSSSSDKNLPATPHVLAAAGDHISVLEARLDDLTTQRTNVSRVLRDLTAPGASNPLTMSFLAERERTKRVQALEEELREIHMQEHDVGLKLLKANKRREREEGSEGFETLWVRRATG